MADQQQPAVPAAVQPDAPSGAHPDVPPAAQPETQPEAQPDVQAAEPIAVNPDAQALEDDADSTLGTDAASSTDSIASSILKYRTIQGRTYHSERQTTEYFTPNDDQQQTSVDITHHYLNIMLDGKLFLAPVKDPKKVLDLGTGTGIWAIDFADTHPDADIIGTDLSPIQPSWVPPNIRFEIDDFLQPWTWEPNSFDFIHMRYLFGAVRDWNELFKQAYNACAPGGYVQSCECDVEINSDDGTIAKDSAMTKFWNPMYKSAREKGYNSFCVLEEGLQRTGIEKAGFEEIKEVNYKLPVGGWPQDPRLAEVGKFVKLTMLNDLEGYTLFMWKNVMQRDDMEAYQVQLAQMRKELKTPGIHGYMKVRYIWGRKPVSA
ncbi:S-adenosyl-L-methionine-dependent methyltransferase [Microdochium bolleyi]|uniref:S-adenosyl-L-methionine-dependent methyltransferase n=1 Tax=Microdochium bolleyi TaxID=196109 RepID=A0A136ILX6_9PEZI|nr:S-adenosyl-L-methionine-dependent methyltransferase [Microdochium bolleyi]